MSCKGEVVDFLQSISSERGRVKKQMELVRYATVQKIPADKRKIKVTER